ncbi:MAG: lysylphosphatidylglycerol synthase transmembrane domain-containing protein [Dongiaceae bacterium]
MSDDEIRRRPAVPRWLTAALQLAVSFGLLVGLVVFADWDALRNAANALSGWRLVTVAAICLAAQAALVLRWRALLDMLGVRESWARSWHSVFAGLFLTNFLPGTLGSDGLRVVLLTKSCGRASTAIGAVAYERLMQFALYLVLVSAAALAPMPWLLPWLRAAIVAAGAGAVMLVVLILYWLGQRSVEAAMGRGGLLQSAWRLFATIMVEIGRMQTRMRRHRRAAIGFWAANILNVCLIFSIWWLVLGDIGHDVGIPTIVLSAGSAAIAAAIPISLGGIGIFEATVMALFSLAGVPPAHALLLALVVRAVFLASSFVGLPSAAMLWRERRS